MTGSIARAGYVASRKARRPPNSAHLLASAQSVREFAADLYPRIAAVDGNVVCSPYSVAVALAMTRVGAREDTAIQMDHVLRAAPQEQFNAGMNALDAHIEALAGPQRLVDGTWDEIALVTADSLWGQRGAEWERSFLDTLAADYGAGMRVVDYIRDADAAAEQINAWTSDRTRGRIPTILPPGVVDAMTRLVLVNAIYFKAPWASPFEKEATKPRPFRRADGTHVQADTMAADVEGAGYARLADCQVLRLNYAGGGVAMSVVLPDGDPSAFEAGLDGARLDRSLAAASSEELVSVQLPRWRFRLASPLNGILTAMGMPLPFDPIAADFSGMSGAMQLYIAAVLHDAFIAVDEDGTEAAAATAVVMGLTAARFPEHEFIADRPFLFVVHDTETLTPLFVGRVSDPTG